MNRRTFLLAVMAGPVLLSGCGTTGTPTPAQVAADVRSIASAMAPAITASLSLITSSAISAKITGAMAEISTIATSIGQASTTTAAQPLVQQILADVQAVAPLLLPLVGLPPQTADVINAALSLLPELAALVGLSLATPGLLVYSPAQARLVLAAAAAKAQ